MKFRYLIAVDPSLTCSGWAIFRIATEGLVAVGKVKSSSPEIALAARLADLQAKVIGIFDQFKLGANDVLVCESPTTMRDPRAAIKVEQVRGIFETVGRSRGLNVPGRLNPRSVQQEVMGLRGRQLRRDIVKDAAVQVVKSVYGTGLKRIGFPIDDAALKKNQDIVDALLIGSLALSRLASATQAGISLEEVFLERTSRVYSLEKLRRLAG